MTALNTDLLKKVARRLTGQIGAGGVADAVVTTIPLSSATNFPTDTAVVAVIDRVDTSGTTTASLEETVIGVISGTNLVTCTRGVEGTAQAHSAGAVVEVLVTAKGWNDLINHLLTEHNQLGGHTNVTACNVTASGTSTLNHVTACDVAASDFTATRTVSASTISASDITASRHLTSCDITTSAIVATSVTARTTNGDLTLAGNGTGKVLQNARYGTPSAGTISASACTFDMSVANTHTLTLTNTSTTTLAVSNVSTGQYFVIRLLQNGTGTNLVAWFATITWVGGTTPTLTTTASKADTFGFYSKSASTFDGFIVGQNI